MVAEYTIQKGDTLTKIAREQYGLQGKEAYNKALEIAKENGIKNPNLIFAGKTLQLNGTKAEEKHEAPVDNFTAEEKTTPEENFANKYQELLAKQKSYAQYQTIKSNNEILDKKFAMEMPKYNPETDNNVTFADAEIFNNADKKVELYKEAALKLASEHIEANDTEDKNGEKDGKIGFEEFAESELAQQENIYKDVDMGFVRKAFIQTYHENYGQMPDEATINDAIQEDIAGIEALYNEDNADILEGLKTMFESYDIDNSGYLEKTEIASMFMSMDAINTASTDKSIRMLGENDEVMAEFDGIIDTRAEVNANNMKIIHSAFFAQ